MSSDHLTFLIGFVPSPIERVVAWLLDITEDLTGRALAAGDAGAIRLLAPQEHAGKHGVLLLQWPGEQLTLPADGGAPGVTPLGVVLQIRLVPIPGDTVRIVAYLRYRAPGQHGYNPPPGPWHYLTEIVIPQIRELPGFRPEMPRFGRLYQGPAAPSPASTPAAQHKRGGRPSTAARNQAILELRARGQTVAEIHQLYGELSEATITRIIRRETAKRQQPGNNPAGGNNSISAGRSVR